MLSVSLNTVTREELGNWETGTDCLQPLFSDLETDCLQNPETALLAKVKVKVEFLLQLTIMCLYRKQSTVGPLKESQELRGLCVS